MLHTVMLPTWDGVDLMLGDLWRRRKMIMAPTRWRAAAV